MQEGPFQKAAQRQAAPHAAFMASRAPPPQPPPAAKPENPYLAMANFNDLDVASPQPAASYRAPPPPAPPAPPMEQMAATQDSQMPTAPAPETVQQIVESQSHADPVEAHVDRVEKQAEEVRKEIEADKKAMKAPAPVMEAAEPAAVTGKLDSDSELADIQEHNPMAYGIVKALLLKKSMGLVKDGPAPAAAEPEATSETSSASDDQGLSSWLGTSSVLSKAADPTPSAAKAAPRLAQTSSVLNQFMSDLD